MVRIVTPRLRLLVALVLFAWSFAVTMAVMVALRLDGVSEALAATPSVKTEAEDLHASVVDLDRSLADLRMSVAATGRLESALDAGPRAVRRFRYTRVEYENELAADLGRCEPEAMLRYEETVPFWVYGNPVLRTAVTAVLRRREIDGARWRRAASGDGSTPRWPSASDPAAERWIFMRSPPPLPPEEDVPLPPVLLMRDAGRVHSDMAAMAAPGPLDEAADRLVRMAAACVNIFFDNNGILDVERLAAGHADEVQVRDPPPR